MEDEVPRLLPTEPLMPAWDDLVSVSDNGVVYSIQIAALHTKFQNILRGPEGQSQVKFRMALPPYSPVDMETWDNGGNMDLNAQNMVSLLPSGNDNGAPEGLCVFLFEVGYQLVVVEEHVLTILIAKSILFGDQRHDSLECPPRAYGRRQEAWPGTVSSISSPSLFRQGV